MVHRKFFRPPTNHRHQWEPPVTKQNVRRGRFRRIGIHVGPRHFPQRYSKPIFSDRTPDSVIDMHVRRQALHRRVYDAARRMGKVYTRYRRCR